MPTRILGGRGRSLVLFLAAPLTLVAQNPNGESSRASTSRSSHAIPVPAAQAAHRSSPIVIDGRLDDAAWREAIPVTDFRQVDPNEGKPATQRTEVRFIFDEHAIYIGAKMYDTAGAAGVRTQLVRRDANFDSDWFQVVIDGYHDHLSRAFFTVNPSGSRQDQIGVGNSCCDSGWDPVYEVATHIDPDGWTAEIRIPLSQLRYSPDSMQTWGLQIRRFILRNNEQDQWSFWKKTEGGGPSRFGHLEGLKFGGAARQVELMPYAVVKSRNEAFAPGDPFNGGHVQSARVGLDLKYLLTPNLTLDATFNPDFGQVEVDPAVVNLSALETFYEEKRPFFIEGSGVFGFGRFNCYFCSNVSGLSAFYSRRIGRAPTGADLAYGAGVFADVPDAATILGAGKITGRTSAGYTLGILDAVTGQANARVALGDGSRTTQEVEPLTNYFVGRLKKDLLDGNLVIGGIGTSVIRRIDDTFAPRLTRHAELLGTDFVYSWNNKTYSLMGQFAISNIAGDARVITARQRSSARYYQRPDRTASPGFLFDNRLDTTATTMTGAGAYMRLAKDAGSWLWETMVNARTPGFETNDLSFLTSADYVYYNANVLRHWTTPTRWYRDFMVIGGAQDQHNLDGDMTSRQAHLYVGTTTPQFWSANAFYLYRPRVMDDRLLRGGPVVERPAQGFLQANIQSDSRHALQFDYSPDYAWNDAGGWGTDHAFNVRYRAASNMLVSFGPSWSSSKSLLQYVTNVSDPTATAFYGTRYVLSSLRQRSLGLDTRVNVTFTPTMTLELYAQPYIASGQYSAFKQYDAPRTSARSTYGIDRGTITPVKDASSGLVAQYTIDPDGTGPAQPFSVANPDFNFRSLRGNAVFRWEYRPGSVLYFAWTHNRSDTAPEGDFDFNRDRSALLAARPDNIFLLKASWWLAR